MEVFARFMSVGVTLLVASHDTALIQSLGYRTLTLEQGKLKHDSAETAL
jgi:cell division transport system ATP-binding protein